MCDREGLRTARRLTTEGGLCEVSDSRFATLFAEAVLSTSIAKMFSWIVGALAVLLLMAFLGALPGLSWYGTVVRRGPTLKLDWRLPSMMAGNRRPPAKC